jgi:hypothetical protein
MVDPAVHRAVEIAGLAVAAAYLWHLRRGDAWREYAVLAVAGLLAEESSMFLYGYYGYGDAWLLQVHRTPLAVALIWPVVVLTSLSLVRRAAGISRAAAAGWTAALVLYDTLVLEPVATGAGLWWWKDGGYFGVPVLGVLGWGIFAAAAAVVLWRSQPARGLRLLLQPLLIVALTQAFLAPLAFPSIADDVTLPISREGYAWGVAALSVLGLPLAWWLRRRVLVAPRHIAFKVAGAAIFFALLYGLWLEPLVGFASLVPLPYLVLTLFRGGFAHRSRGAWAPPAAGL